MSTGLELQPAISPPLASNTHVVFSPAGTYTLDATGMLCLYSLAPVRILFVTTAGDEGDYRFLVPEDRPVLMEVPRAAVMFAVHGDSDFYYYSVAGNPNKVEYKPPQAPEYVGQYPVTGGAGEVAYDLQLTGTTEVIVSATTRVYLVFSRFEDEPTDGNFPVAPGTPMRWKLSEQSRIMRAFADEDGVVEIAYLGRSS